MATQTVEFRAAPGLSLTVRLFAIGSDTIVQTASSCTEATNRKGTYAAVFTDPGADEFELVALNGTTPVCRWFVTLTLTTATFQSYEVRTQAVVAPVTVGTNNDKTGYSLAAGTGLGNQTANITGNLSGSVGSVTGAVGSVTAAVTVGTNNDKTGYSLATAPPTAAAIADAVWDEAYAGHTTAGTFGKLMDTLRKANTVLEGTIQASPTPTTSVFKLSGVDYPTGALIGSVLWMNSGASQEQNSPILNTVNNGDGTITVTLENALVTAPSAGDTVLIDPTSHVHSVAEIQSGLATAANLLIAIDRVSYCLSALAGNCSTAQTATETYVLSIGGNTYTAAYSGLDASGNRGTTTLTKA